MSPADLGALPALERARFLVGLGLSVIPIRPGSKVASIKWEPYQERHPTDAELVAWFDGKPNAPMAIVTGAISGLVVVDADSPEALAWAEEHLPPTPIRVRTGKGLHLYYRHPGTKVRNRARIRTGQGKLALDVRGDGGYVLAPGSPHPEGGHYAAEGDCIPEAFR